MTSFAFRDLWVWEKNPNSGRFRIAGVQDDDQLRYVDTQAEADQIVGDHNKKIMLELQAAGRVMTGVQLTP
jgi:hypothetical protein